MKKYFFIFQLAILAIILFQGCADVVNIEACRISEPYGFFSGLWHGLIAGISFIGSLFSEDIAIYAVNNTGGWYDFGFLLGIGMNSGTTYVIRKE